MENDKHEVCYTEILCPKSKQEDILAFLGKYECRIIVHETGENSLIIEAVNPHQNRNIFISLGNNFTLYFGDLRTRYSSHEYDYAQMKEDVANIIEKNATVMSAFADGKWISSIMYNKTPDWKSNERTLMREFHFVKEQREKMAAMGGKITTYSWRPFGDWEYRIYPVYSTPYYKFPSCSAGKTSIRFIVRGKKNYGSGSIARFTDKEACLRYMYVDRHIEKREMRFLYDQMEKLLEADAKSGGFQSIFAIANKIDLNFYLKRGYQIVEEKPPKELEDVLGARVGHKYTVQKYLVGTIGK